ncbi:MAG TPA: rRNA maturation RNase YbeY [Phycisphaerae bacterium]|nr:rRNA maturation RNase YbeY [Phycisphaerae bacterium]HNU46135.1 rRNA maturation RNase YbeY [Phycisphaerae bacterium]
MDEDEPYQIDIACLGPQTVVPEASLAAAVGATLRRHDVARARLSLAVVDDPHITRLNETYLQHAGPTDVLAFDLRDQAWMPLDGEIVVSAETARRVAQQRGHDWTAELLLYVVHGTLHLLGYDDQEAEAARRMHEVEDEILMSLGVGAVYGSGEP